MVACDCTRFFREWMHSDARVAEKHANLDRGVMRRPTTPYPGTVGIISPFGQLCGGMPSPY